MFTQQQISSKILEIAGKTSQRYTLNSESCFDQICTQDGQLKTIMCMVENEFHITIPESVYGGIKTIGALCIYVNVLVND